MTELHSPFSTPLSQERSMCTVSAGTGAVRGTGTFHDRCPGMGVYGTRKARLSARGRSAYWVLSRFPGLPMASKLLVMACSFCPELIRKRRGEVRALLSMMLCMERTKPEGPRPPHRTNERGPPCRGDWPPLPPHRLQRSEDATGRQMTPLDPHGNSTRPLYLVGQFG